MSRPIVEKAEAIIRGSNLHPLEHKILRDFIQKGEDPEVAAGEFLRRIDSSKGDVIAEEAIYHLLLDWRELVETGIRPHQQVPAELKKLVSRRDRHRCCVTSPDAEQVYTPKAAFIISPNILSPSGCEDGNEELRRHKLLEVFLAQSGMNRLLSILSPSNKANNNSMLKNTWVLAPGAIDALQRGYVNVLPDRFSWGTFDENTVRGAPEVKYFFVVIPPGDPQNFVLADGSWFYDGRYGGYRTFYLHTEDPEALPLPDPFVLRIHSRFATAVHLFDLMDSVRKGWPLRQPTGIWDGRTLIQTALRAVWGFLPTLFRTWSWRKLLEEAKSRPQPSWNTSSVLWELRWGLVAKTWGGRGNAGNEANALKLLEQYAPDIPAPRYVDRFRDAGGDEWFVMTKLPGVPVADVLWRMSHAERDRLAADISSALEQVHKIPNKSTYRFANTLGGPLDDRRIGDSMCGPFNSEADLNRHLVKGGLYMADLKAAVPSAFERTHNSVFTHGDLYLSNILVDSGRFSGMVDWEFAAFMPEYWDCTKARWAPPAGWNDWEDLYRGIWGDKYDEELKAEKWLWSKFPWGL